MIVQTITFISSRTCSCRSRMSSARLALVSSSCGRIMLGGRRRGLGRLSAFACQRRVGGLLSCSVSVESKPSATIQALCGPKTSPLYAIEQGCMVLNDDNCLCKIGTPKSKMTKKGHQCSPLCDCPNDHLHLQPYLRRGSFVLLGFSRKQTISHHARCSAVQSNLPYM